MWARSLTLLNGNRTGANAGRARSYPVDGRARRGRARACITPIRPLTIAEARWVRRTLSGGSRMAEARRLRAVGGRSLVFDSFFPLGQCRIGARPWTGRTSTPKGQGQTLRRLASPGAPSAPEPRSAHPGASSATLAGVPYVRRNRLAAHRLSGRLRNRLPRCPGM